MADIIELDPDSPDAEHFTVESSGKAVDAYNQYLHYKAQMYKYSEINRQMGDARYRAEKQIRDLLPQAYGFLETLPEYFKLEDAVERRVPHGKTMAWALQGAALQMSGRVSKAQIGLRNRAARDVMIGAADKAVGTMVEIRQHETKRKDMYVNLKRTARQAYVGVADFRGSLTATTSGRVVSQLAKAAGQRANALAYSEAYKKANRANFGEELLGGISAAVSGYIQGGGTFGDGNASTAGLPVGTARY